MLQRAIIKLMAVRGLQRWMVFGGILVVALVAMCFLEPSKAMAEAEIAQDVELITE